MSERCKGGINRVSKGTLDSNFPTATELGCLASLYDLRKGGVYFVKTGKEEVAVKIIAPCSPEAQMICANCPKKGFN